MVKAGLNAGEMFEDNGVYYRVLEVIANGYISEMVSEDEFKKPAAEAVEEKEEKPKRTYKKK